MKLFLTDPVGVEVQGRRFDGQELAGRQTRLVFAALVAGHGRPVTRDELADLLWPDHLPASWEAALRNVVSRVRSFLTSAGFDPDVLVSAYSCWQLPLAEGVTVDVHVALEQLAGAERALRAGETERAGDLADEAQDTFSRPFLPGEQGHWVEQWRADLTAWRLRALEIFAEARLSGPDVAQAVLAAARAVAVDPFRESSHRLLIRAHRAGGDRAASLRAYERCRRILAEELGVSPSPETESLYLDLLGTEAAPQTGSSSQRVRRPSRSGPLVVAVPDLPDTGLPFVGRARELSAVAAAWRDAARGRNRVLVIRGEPGTGKTALAVRAAAIAAGDGATVLYGRADPDGLPYQAIAEALSRYARACPRDRLAEELEVAGPDVARLVPSLRARLTPALRGQLLEERADVAPTGVADPTLPHRHALFDSVATLLGLAAAMSPVVLVLDDLHWAAPPTLQLVRHLVGALDAQPVLFVLTSRAAPDGVAALVESVRGEAVAGRIDLSALGRAEVSELAAEVADTPEHRAQLLGVLWDRTAGNPFLVVELLRHLRALPIDELERASPPSTVQDAIVSRWRRLPPGGLRAIEVGAVIGQQFEVSLAQRVTGLDETTLVVGLDAAIGEGIVHEVDAPVPTVGFSHAIVRDAVYERLGPARRAQLHRRVADALARRLPEVAPPPATAIVRHLSLAGAFADPAEALRYATLAGEDARAQLAWEVAARRFSDALTLAVSTDAPDSQRLDLLLRLADAEKHVGQLDRARVLHLEAIALARRTGNARALAVAALGLAGGNSAMSGWFPDREHAALLEDALARLGNGDAALRVRLTAQLALALQWQEIDDRPMRLAVAAVEEARRLGDQRALAGALAASRVALAGPVNTTARLALATEIAGIGVALGDEELTTSARLTRVSDLFELADRLALEAELAAASDAAARLRHPALRWRVAAWSALLAIVDGRDDADESLDSALAVWEDVPPNDAERVWAAQLFTWRAVNGRGAEMLPMIRDGADTYGVQLQAYQCAFAMVLAETGALVEARGIVDRIQGDAGLHRLAQTEFTERWLTTLALLSETCFVVRDPHLAEELYPLLEPFGDRMAVVGGDAGSCFWGSVHTQLGLHLATMGRTADAEERLVAGIEANRRFGAHPWAARAERQLTEIRAVRTGGQKRSVGGGVAIDVR